MCVNYTLCTCNSSITFWERWQGDRSVSNSTQCTDYPFPQVYLPGLNLPFRRWWITSCVCVCVFVCAGINAFYLMISVDSTCGWIESTADFKGFISSAAPSCACARVCLRARVYVVVCEVRSHWCIAWRNFRWCLRTLEWSIFFISLVCL